MKVHHSLRFAHVWASADLLEAEFRIDGGDRPEDMLGANEAQPPVVGISRVGVAATGGRARTIDAPRKDLSLSCAERIRKNETSRCTPL